MDVVKFLYYVVFRRVLSSSAINSTGAAYDCVNILTFDEAVSGGWVDFDGKRIWIFGPDNEGRCQSFVFGFNDLDEAITFCETLYSAEIGIKVKEDF